MNYVKAAMLPAVLTAVPVFFVGMLRGAAAPLSSVDIRYFRIGRACHETD